MRKKSRIRNINLLEFLAQKYKKSGWDVYSKGIRDFKGKPEEWVGILPDLITVKDEEIKAVCIESSSSLTNGNALKKWKEIRKNKNAKLMIIVREEKTLELAKQIAETNNIYIESLVVKKVVHRKKIWKGTDIFGKKSKIDWIIVITGIVISLCFLYFFVIQLHDFFKVEEFYQPHDQERQKELLQKLDDYLK